MSAPAPADVLVSWVGDADGSRELAAALACVGSEVDRPGLLIELGEQERQPRPALVATAAAREMEGRIAAHLSGATVAARGRICHLAAGADEDGLAAARAAQPLARGAVCVVLPPPALALEALSFEGVRADIALLRADLDEDRPLVALATRALMARGLRVSIAKQPLPWAVGRMALFGALPEGARGASARRHLERCAA
jgi:hypothetical protein